MSNITDSSGLVSGSGIANNDSLPQSPTSMVSSSSETLSISDEQITTASARSTPKTSRKSSKDERPPWRTVIIAPPQKVNKNALLKAKILDATRRALLAQKINHVATQTDAYATMLREKSTGIQDDLIVMLDKCEATDGTITIRKDRPGGLIITQTVGQMTDDKLSTTIATQTPLPQTHLSFSSLTGSAVVHPQHSNRQQSSNSKFSPFEQKILENELLLQTQRNALKNIDRILNDEQFIDKCANRKIAEHLNDEQQKRSTSLKQSTNLTQSKTMRMRGESTLEFESVPYGHDFDIDTENDLPDLPRRTISDGSTPWNNFKDIVIGQRLEAMTLAPMEKRRKTGANKNGAKKKSVTWNDRQLAVTKLINEASALIDIFNEVSCMIGPDMNLKCAIKSTPQNAMQLNIPESKWQPLLSESCNDLHKTLNNFKPNNHLSSEQLINVPKKPINK